MNADGMDVDDANTGGAEADGVNAGTPEPGPADGVRPADEARRALRAAREREPRAPWGHEPWGHEPDDGRSGAPSAPHPAPAPGPEPEPRSPAGPAASDPRPGDLAREALRASRPGGTVDPSAAAAPAHDAGPTPARDAGPPAGARPGDTAREALRAARKREARARADAAAEAVARGRAARSAGRPAAPRPAAQGGRAQELRALLADAFRLPDDETRTDETPADATRVDETRADATRADEARTAETRIGQTHGAEPPASATTLASAAAPASTPATAPAPGASGRPSAPMAASRRDGESRRTFAAFTARASRGSEFARTWWGNAWVSALEQGALDAARLARGRAYADRGNVDAITVTPGLVLAYVHGSRPRPYRVQLRLRTLSDDDWDRFLDAADRPGHIAALLDKEMPRSLAECGVDLLPGPRDIQPRCSCPDSGHPCKHAAALCYQTARLLDEDPFVLLLLRGRGERELLDALSRLSAARAARAAQDRAPAPPPGVRARDAVARRTLPPLPAPLPVPPHPEQPPVYPGAPGGPDPFALDQLATDAAGRAHALLATGRDPVAGLTLWQDAVRLAAARPGSGLTAATRSLYQSLASAAGRTPGDLARAVAAWRQGGYEALTVLEEPWDPPAGRFDRARPLLRAADLPAFRPWRNHLTHPHGHVQLRLGQGGLWYAYESEPGQDDWWPRGTPDLDPVGALTGLGSV
ncbi:SWIM zinc finger family protein [Streptomyces sp. NPDC008313]|uniref:SWIM zinc finger family protein n=1 Tax=Streptomyces sp. NPDC008313 TaxID=3364826 RepID=UPI0036EDFDF5